MHSDSGKRLENELMAAVNEIDKGYLRKMQADMHRCAAVCCDDTTSSIENVQRCIRNCNSKLQAAHRFVQEEVNSFHDRLNRCHMACSDKIRDEISSNPSESESQKYKEKLDKCAENCAETHIKVIASLLKRTKSALSQNEFQSSLM